ncbi:hypothetical protein BC831DRAFT_481435 [Entophlyctis helioformis]|nr:hypothetical protein BC831DRAFT_481435 [Entophlyctis helioformis]
MHAYLQPNFDPNKATINELVSALAAHDVPLPTSRRLKAFYVELFRSQLQPRIPAIVAARAAVLPSAAGIVLVDHRTRTETPLAADAPPPHARPPIRPAHVQIQPASRSFRPLPPSFAPSPAIVDDVLDTNSRSMTDPEAAVPAAASGSSDPACRAPAAGLAEPAQSSALAHGQPAAPKGTPTKLPLPASTAGGRSVSFAPKVLPAVVTSGGHLAQDDDGDNQENSQPLAAQHPATPVRKVVHPRTALRQTLRSLSDENAARPTSAGAADAAAPATPPEPRAKSTSAKTAAEPLGSQGHISEQKLRLAEIELQTRTRSQRRTALAAFGSSKHALDADVAHDLLASTDLDAGKDIAADPAADESQQLLVSVSGLAAATASPSVAHSLIPTRVNKKTRHAIDGSDGHSDTGNHNDDGNDKDMSTPAKTAVPGSTPSKSRVPVTPRSAAASKRSSPSPRATSQLSPGGLYHRFAAHHKRSPQPQAPPARAAEDDTKVPTKDRFVIFPSLPGTRTKITGTVPSTAPRTNPFKTSDHATETYKTVHEIAEEWRRRANEDPIVPVPTQIVAAAKAPKSPAARAFSPSRLYPDVKDNRVSQPIVPPADLQADAIEAAPAAEPLSAVHQPVTIHDLADDGSNDEDDEDFVPDSEDEDDSEESEDADDDDELDNKATNCELVAEEWSNLINELHAPLSVPPTVDVMATRAADAPAQVIPTETRSTPLTTRTSQTRQTRGEADPHRLTIGSIFGMVLFFAFYSLPLVSFIWIAQSATHSRDLGLSKSFEMARSGIALVHKDPQFAFEIVKSNIADTTAMISTETAKVWQATAKEISMDKVDAHLQRVKAVLADQAEYAERVVLRSGKVAQIGLQQAMTQAESAMRFAAHRLPMDEIRAINKQAVDAATQASQAVKDATLLLWNSEQFKKPKLMIVAAGEAARSGYDDLYKVVDKAIQPYMDKIPAEVSDMITSRNLMLLTVTNLALIALYRVFYPRKARSVGAETVRSM